MDKMDKSLLLARKSYDEAKGQLTSGPGNVIRQVEMLDKLGAKNSKQFPDGWDGGASEIEGEQQNLKTPEIEAGDLEETENVPEFLTSPDQKS